MWWEVVPVRRTIVAAFTDLMPRDLRVLEETGIALLRVEVMCPP